MEFICSNCNYKSSVKCNIKKHISNIIICNNASILTVFAEFKCEHCNKKFSTRQNLNRHINTCKALKNNIEEEIVKPNNIIQINDKVIVKLENPISDNEISNDVDEELTINQIPTEQILSDIQTMAGY